jgi:hypothetical protein
MTWVDTAITIGILLALAIIIYCRVTNKTLPEFISEIREIFSPEEEVSRL